MNKLFFPILGAAAFLSVSCSSDDSSPKSSPITLTRTQEEVVAQNNKMALGFFNEIVKESDENAENLVFSPLSLSNAFGMLANGADGKTLEEIKSVMGYESLDDVNELHARLIRQLPSTDSKVKVSIANALWSDIRSYSFLPDYTQNCLEYYNASCEQTDLYSMEGANKINAWVSKKTDGVINSVYNEEPGCDLILSNALYLKGEWSEKFELEKTNTPFHNLNGTRSYHKFMKSSQKTVTTIGETLSAVAIPYGSELYRMVIIIPTDDEYVLSSLSIDELSDIYARLNADHKSTVIVEMPEFKINSNWDLNEICKTLGIQTAFSTKYADFTKMTFPNAFVSKVLHIASIEVNKDGAEAAVETSVEMVNTSPGNIVKAHFVIDRPFIYLIEETSSGAILFMGKVNKL